jgi:hypothetical protein
MPTVHDSNDWPQHSPEQWYISFCLMMSSVQDHLTGVDLRSRGNLNWGTTCHYYCLVHAARLIAFCVTGDYHTGYEQLRKFLSSAFGIDRPGTRPKAPVARPVNFNWLRLFVSGEGSASVSPESFRHEAGRALDLDERIAQFANLFDYLGELRTDTNYEALLIAHEKHHKVVEEAFQKLCDLAERAGCFGAKLAVSVYNTHLHRSELFGDRRASFLSISDKYVSDRFSVGLRDKFGESELAVESLETLRRLLQSHDAFGTADFEDIENAIRMEQFSPKSRLMDGFGDRIEEFAVRVRCLPIAVEDPDADSA